MQPPPGWTAPELASNIMAGISLLISSILAYQRWQDRWPDVLVEARIAPLTPTDTAPRLILDIRNRSDRIIYLRRVAISSAQLVFKDVLWKGPPSTWRVVDWPYPTAVTYSPHELLPGKSITDVLNPRQLADFLAAQGQSGTVWFQGCLKDEMGNVYPSKPMKFEMTQWLLPGLRVSSPLFHPVGGTPPEPVMTPMYSPSEEAGGEGG